VVVSTADSTYRGQFFYDDDELLGPVDRVFDDLADCVLALLRLQADHERQRRAAGIPVSSDEGRPPKREAA
jgi:hypothetical protein